MSEGQGRGAAVAVPPVVARRAEKALNLLVTNSHHPSLGVKKVKSKAIEGFENVFEGRFTRDYRFFFLIETNTFVLLRLW